MVFNNKRVTAVIQTTGSRVLIRVHRQFRRFDIVAGVVFAILVIVGVLTVNSGSESAANSSPTAAAGPASAPAVARSGTLAPSTTPPPTRSQALRRPPSVPTAAPVPDRVTPAQAAPTTRSAPPPPTRAAPPPPPPPAGATGVAGDGKAIKCEDNDGWRWEPI